MRHGAEVSDGVCTYNLDEAAANMCISLSASQVQENCVLPLQNMCVLHGDDFNMPLGGDVFPDLSDIITEQLRKASKRL